LHPLPAPSPFAGERQYLGEFVLHDPSLREQDLHETRHRPANGLSVAGIEVRAEREVAVDDLREVVPPHLAERLGKVVDDEPVVVREEVGAKRCSV
jgi:hypothetical protein